MNTEDMRQHFEPDGSPRRLASRTDGERCSVAVGSAVPEWAAKEIRDTWRAARDSESPLESFRIIERMIARLGYGRIENNPPLLPNQPIFPV